MQFGFGGVRRKPQKKRCVNVVVVILYIGECVVQNIVLKSPHFFVRTDKVYRVRHQVVEPFIPGIRAVDSIMHDSMPSPLTMYRVKIHHEFEIPPKMIREIGTKNSSNMMMDLTTMGVLPNLLILLSFKYAETRALSVDEKSD